jgi:hypothetical protein
MPGIVYVIGISNGLIMKVGKTDKPKARFIEHRRVHGDIDIIYTQEEHDPYRVETAAHRILKPHRIAPERFGIDADTAVNAVKRAGILVAAEPVINFVYNRETSTFYKVPLIPPPRIKAEDDVIFADIRADLASMEDFNTRKRPGPKRGFRSKRTASPRDEKAVTDLMNRLGWGPVRGG